MEQLLLVSFAYLLGSVLFGDVIARLRDVDLRRVGSGNVGATNTARVLGKKAGVLVFLLDMLKGFIPVSLALNCCGAESYTVALVGIASVVGHVFPLFYRWKGGKGVATAFGVVLAISLWHAFILLLLWAGVLYWKRYVSLASITACSFAPVLFLASGYPFHLFLMSAIVSALIILKHRPNINRLLKGEELKV